MSGKPEDVHDDRVRELSDRFAFHLEWWARRRTPLWARHSFDAQSVVRETLIEVVQSRENEKPGSERALLTSIRRTLYESVRDRIHTARDVASVERKQRQARSAERSVRDPILETELLQRYESALSRLSPIDREAVIARAELGLPWSDVTELLGKPGIAAARLTVSRALVRLAREMSHDCNG
jgi:DNA-directed RNA polymerase specialized sigma24 family protein